MNAILNGRTRGLLRDDEVVLPRRVLVFHAGQQHPRDRVLVADHRDQRSPCAVIDVFLAAIREKRRREEEIKIPSNPPRFRIKPEIFKIKMGKRWGLWLFSVYEKHTGLRRRILHMGAPKERRSEMRARPRILPGTLCTPQ